MRTELGGENTDVWRLMNDTHNGPSAVITGSSAHNERIERLWNDVRRSVTEEFRCLFYQLEHDGSLNPLNETDMFCLHCVFENRINRAINEFAVAWNNHKLSTEGNRSPNQLFMTGMLALSSFHGSTPMLPRTPVAAQQGVVNNSARHSAISLPGALSHVCVLSFSIASLKTDLTSSKTSSSVISELTLIFPQSPLAAREDRCLPLVIGMMTLLFPQ